MSRREADEWIFNIQGRVSEEVGTPQIARQRGWMPHIDLLESETHLLIRVDLAGVPPRAIHISFNEERSILTLKGERPNGIEPTSPRYKAHLLEIEEGEFSREIVLPELHLAYESTKAEMKLGILSILIPILDQDDHVVVVERLTMTKF